MADPIYAALATKVIDDGMTTWPAGLIDKMNPWCKELCCFDHRGIICPLTHDRMMTYDESSGSFADSFWSIAAQF